VVTAASGAGPSEVEFWPQAKAGQPAASGGASSSIEYELKRLSCDIAVSGDRPAIAALTALGPMSQILFGSDFP